MSQILLYCTEKTEPRSSSKNAQSQMPVVWFEGVFGKNEIPYPALYNQNELKSKNGELILDAQSYFFQFNLTEVIRIESNPSGSSVFLNGNNYWLTNTAIDFFEIHLKEYLFFRIHTNHLVNLRFLKRIVKCNAFVLLSNSEAIPVDAVNDNSIFSFLEGKELI